MKSHPLSIRRGFRASVKARDGPACVFSTHDADSCDAAHIIPKCKGDNVPFIIVSRPSHHLITNLKLPLSTLLQFWKIVSIHHSTTSRSRHQLG